MKLENILTDEITPKTLCVSLSFDRRRDSSCHHHHRRVVGIVVVVVTLTSL